MVRAHVGYAGDRSRRWDERGSPSMTVHPLDPLTADEIRAAVAIVRRDREVGDRWRFASIELREPSKATVREYGDGDPIERAARIVCWDRDSGSVYQGLVSLTEDRVVSWRLEPDGQPNMTNDEYYEADAALRRDPRVIEALRQRGITDMELVLVDTWAYGAHLLPEEYAGRRLGWADVWYRADASSNPYANPVSGLHLIVDLNRMELLEVEDDYSVPAPETMGEYVPGLVPGLRLRDDIKPLEIVQPEGSSLQLDGNLVRWQKWSVRVGFNYREGLILHTVGYDDDGRTRPVAHRMSFLNMVVPYRDPSSEHYRRTAFDIGEWGLGFMTTSLERGCDCLGEITYLDAVLHDTSGEPYDIPRAVCIHEEDNGVLWKHADQAAGAEVRRMRRLVISCHATVANYEYLVYWRFYQDGSIECEVRATGLMVTSAFPAGQPPPTGTVVDDRTYAPFHQHFIVARLDLDVDGPDNTVLACGSAARPVSAANPHGLDLVVRETPLRTELEGRQDCDWASQRTWKIASASARNRLGAPAAYKLVPGGSFPPLFDPSALPMRRGEVIGHQLWATPHHDDERWPCGEFPNLSATDTGLPAWTAADRPIEGTDVVLWHVFGLHHITRPEDWPVMPVDRTSFWLKPWGFFDRNPALDVPPTPHR